eukprot:CAMPEP_0175127788 /NCGR_PEP_ID=MMETSP0087-20121206/4574_1 /TAXON_ID=136419 /ORGANISM="Unknown Unknown, Strain D1" /LENGTH=81 /DNA_ID=CAMNT_0016409791 /DNA_START=129 /DNA_END=374 /DNA_ORIENTATION=+
MCSKTLSSKWNVCLSQWEGLKEKASEDKLGPDIEKVVTDLDAPHLLPSGILKRMETGIAPACYGLATLLNNLNQQSHSDHE